MKFGEKLSFLLDINCDGVNVAHPKRVVSGTLIGSVKNRLTPSQQEKKSENCHVENNFLQLVLKGN